jgi:site-specific DNA-methyltransferase (adenine-specific)
MAESTKSQYTILDERFSIALGDAIDCLRELPDASVDFIITDPPYNLGLFMKKRGTNMNKLRDGHFAASGWDDLNFNDWVLEMDKLFSECHRVLKKKGNLIMFMSIIKVETLIALAEKHKFYYKTVGVWHKTNPIPRNMNLHFINSTETWIYLVNDGTTGTFNNDGKAIHDFIETSTISTKERKFGKHPTQKPIGLLNHFVELLSNENDVVLDPFMGSGSTGVSCKELNRKFIGIELNSDYFELAKKRILDK